MKKVVLAGGTGNLGTLLTAAFADLGWMVVILTRNAVSKNTSHISYVEWDGTNLGDWTEALTGAEVIINLSGKSIQCRFTETNKKALYDSRISPTKVLGKAIQQMPIKPKLWINFSGISLFNQLLTIQDENSTAIGKGFLATLTEDWEQSFTEINISDVHKVILRISPVLMRDSGFFAELLPLVNMGLGGKVSDGKQFLNWIHYKDFIHLVLWIVNHNNPSAVYHACSPNPSTNAVFMQDFRKAVGISLGLPLPKFMAKIGAFAKGVDPSLLLDSVPVTTTQTIGEGFVFEYPNTEIAIKELLTKST